MEEKNLDCMARDLQMRIHKLMGDMKYPLIKDYSYGEAKGISYTIKKLNLIFGKMYETDIEKIENHYDKPLQKE